MIDAELYVDGHVEWRDFKMMKREIQTGLSLLAVRHSETWEMKKKGDDESAK